MNVVIEKGADVLIQAGQQPVSGRGSVIQIALGVRRIQRGGQVARRVRQIVSQPGDGIECACGRRALERAAQAEAAALPASARCFARCTVLLLGVLFFGDRIVLRLDLVECVLRALKADASAPIHIGSHIINAVFLDFFKGICYQMLRINRIYKTAKVVQHILDGALLLVPLAEQIAYQQFGELAVRLHLVSMLCGVIKNEGFAEKYVFFHLNTPYCRTMKK